MCFCDLWQELAMHLGRHSTSQHAAVNFCCNLY